MRKTKVIRWELLPILGLLGLALPGCLITSEKVVDEHGTPVSASTLQQIEPGVTTEAWLIATLGEPTSRSTVESEDDVEILKYEHVVVSASSGTVFLLFAGVSGERARSTTYFEIHDGVVTRYWTEQGTQ